MTKVKTNFSYHTVDVGLEVYKRSWNAAVFLDGVYVRNVHQPPSPKALHSFLTGNFFPEVIIGAYESGKFGYWIQRHKPTPGVFNCIATIVNEPISAPVISSRFHTCLVSPL